MFVIDVYAVLLILIGLWAIIVKKNIIRMILGFSILDTGVNILIVNVGYIKGRTAPIIDSALKNADAVHKVVDPIPSALVLTAIVIGLAVTALMLSYAVRMYKEKTSMSIDDYEELKW